MWLQAKMKKCCYIKDVLVVDVTVRRFEREEERINSPRGSRLGGLVMHLLWDRRQG